MKHTIQLVVAAALLAYGVGSGTAQEAPRSASGDRAVLQLDGVNCGFLRSAGGGQPIGEVTNEAAGSAYYVKKHIGNVKYEDVGIQLGFTMEKPIYDWISASWEMNYQRKNGAIVAATYDLKAISQLEFYNALITETTIPACDGDSKEPAYMTVKFAPEYTRHTKASGKVELDNLGSDQRRWIPSDFKLEIDGLDCTRVKKVDSFSIKQKLPAQGRDEQAEPGKLEFPNLKITLSNEDLETWTQWHKEFLLQGNNDEGKEKNGSLVFLNRTRQKELARIKLFNLGIFYLGPDRKKAPRCECCKEAAPATDPKDPSKSVTVELYCERMEFRAGGN